MWHRAKWWVIGLRQKLWSRPLLFAAMAVAAVAAAAVADRYIDPLTAPRIERETLEDLLHLRHGDHGLPALGRSHCPARAHGDDRRSRGAGRPRGDRHRRQWPFLGGVPLDGRPPEGPRVHTKAIGYVQSINVGALQRAAEQAGTRVFVEALPGTFAGPGRALARLEAAAGAADAAIATEMADGIAAAFRIGEDRTFDEDPRFGLVTLAEIAARALSPAVNDPGTAIDIIGTFVRLFARWAEPREETAVLFDRVVVPALSEMDMFDDACTAIARDGAGAIEVAVRLQKAFAGLASLGDGALRDAARRHSRLALARAERALTLDEERDLVRALAADVERSASTEGVR